MEGKGFDPSLNVLTNSMKGELSKGGREREKERRRKIVRGKEIGRERERETDRKRKRGET